MTAAQSRRTLSIFATSTIATVVAAATVVGPLAQPAYASTHSVANQSQFVSAINSINALCDGSDHHISIAQDIAFSGSTDAVYSCDDDLTIEGTTFLHTQVNGSAGTNLRFLDAFDSLGTITFRHLSIDNFGGDGVQRGGAIRTDEATIVIDDVLMSGNEADNGGAIAATGSTWVEVNESTLSGNHADDNGGAIFLLSGGFASFDSAYIENTSEDLGGAISKREPGFGIYDLGGVYTGNTASLAGGAIFQQNAPINLQRAMFTDNSAVDGGAIRSAGGDFVTVSSTYVGNTASTNGALNIAGTGAEVNIYYSTFVDNAARHILAPGSGASIKSFGSVYFGSTVTACSATSVESSGYNWASDSSCVGAGNTGDVSNGTNPMLGNLAFNGGTNASMRPLPGSPLIDAIPAGALLCEFPGEVADQRYLPRLIGDGCDIGAVEVFTTFSDVSDSAPAHPFLSEIGLLVGFGIAGGYPDGTFRPGAPVSRQAMAAFLYRLDGEPAFTPPATPSFTDVSTSHPFFFEIEWLVDAGVTSGYPDDTFRPGAPVSRQAMAAFLYRAIDGSGFSAPATPTFSDVPPSHAFYDEIEWLASSGYAGGYADGTFRPGASVSRQAMAAFLTRAILD